MPQCSRCLGAIPEGAALCPACGEPYYGGPSPAPARPAPAAMPQGGAAKSVPDHGAGVGQPQQPAASSTTQNQTVLTVSVAAVVIVAIIVGAILVVRQAPSGAAGQPVPSTSTQPQPAVSGTEGTEGDGAQATPEAGESLARSYSDLMSVRTRLESVKDEINDDLGHGSVSGATLSDARALVDEATRVSRDIDSVAGGDTRDQELSRLARLYVVRAEAMQRGAESQASGASKDTWLPYFAEGQQAKRECGYKSGSSGGKQTWTKLPDGLEARVDAAWGN